MKKIFLVFIIIFIVSGLVFSQSVQKKQTEKKEMPISAGVGIGIPYGVIGCGIEVTPIQYLGITGGIGYALEGIGYSFGVRVYPIPMGDRPWTPMISAYYGVIGVIVDRETFTGGAIGGGVKYKKSKYSITAEILYLIHKKKWYIDYGSPVKISVGFLWHL